MKPTVLDIKARIIRKLVQWRKWGASHTENILKGLPSHLRGDKITKQSLKELEKDEWIILAKKTGKSIIHLTQKKQMKYYNFMKNIVKQNFKNTGFF